MEKIKILIVDDESRMRKLVKDFLGREGYLVREAGDGMEALEIFYEENHPGCHDAKDGRMADLQGDPAVFPSADHHADGQIRGA